MVTSILIGLAAGFGFLLGGLYAEFRRGYRSSPVEMCLMSTDRALRVLHPWVGFDGATEIVKALRAAGLEIVERK